MAGKRGTKAVQASRKGLKRLTAKKLTARDETRVKAGYMGETEKLKGSVSSINWGDGKKP